MPDGVLLRSGMAQAKGPCERFQRWSVYASSFQFAYYGPLLVSRLLLTPVKMCEERDGGRAAEIDKPRLWVKLRDIYSSLKYWSSD